MNNKIRAITDNTSERLLFLKHSALAMQCTLKAFMEYMDVIIMGVYHKDPPTILHECFAHLFGQIDADANMQHIVV